MQIMDTVNLLENKKKRKITFLSSYIFTIRRMDKKDLVCLSTERVLFVPELYLL